jgi:hypothetical protein
MVRGIVLPASLAAVLALPAAAGADEDRDAVKIGRDVERPRIERLDEDRFSDPRPVRLQTRHRHRYGYRAWNGRYGNYPRQHFFVSGVHAYGYGPVNVATVAYRSYVYYTPTYPSVSYGYPPHAYVYDLTHGPVYNKPCFC